MDKLKASGGMEAAELALVLQAAQGGDAEAWGQLYKGFAPAMYRFCRRALPTREDAEDATSEIFMKLRSKLGQAQFAPLILWKRHWSELKPSTGGCRPS